MPAALSSFLYQKRIAFNTSATGANTSASVSNFPVLIRINSTTWSNSTERTHLFTNSSAKRVQFFDSSGNNLAYESLKFDTANSEALYWVRVPTLNSGSTSNYIWMAYGNDPNGADQDQKATTWSQNYNHVYHMGDNGWGGSAPEMLDSVGSSSGTKSGTLNARTGSVGEGRDFTASPYVAVSNASTLTPQFPTYALSFNADTVSSLRMLVSKDYSGTNQRQFQIGIEPTGNLKGYIWNAAHSVTYGYATVSASTEYRIVVTYDGTDVNMYANGSLSGGNAMSGTGIETTSGGNMNVGRWTYDSTRLFDGMIDEFYIVNGVWTTSWIKLDYWNINKQISTSGDWITWDTETSPQSSYINIYQSSPTSGGFNGTKVTSAAPIVSGNLQYGTTTEGSAIKCAVRANPGLKPGSGSITITPTGTNASKWALAPDSSGSPGTFGAYGAALTLTSVTDTNKIFWAKAKVTSDETAASTDLTATLQVPQTVTAL